MFSVLAFTFITTAINAINFVLARLSGGGGGGGTFAVGLNKTQKNHQVQGHINIEFFI